VIIPHGNKRELKEIPRNVLDKLTIHPVKTIDEVLKIALLHLEPADNQTHMTKTQKPMQEHS